MMLFELIPFARTGAVLQLGNEKQFRFPACEGEFTVTGSLCETRFLRCDWSEVDRNNLPGPWQRCITMPSDALGRFDWSVAPEEADARMRP